MSTHCFDYYKCIFIHIPKTAGLSVSKALFGNFAGTHLNIDHYLTSFGRHTVMNYFKFTFVRNPWDRLYSAFSFIKSGGLNEDDKAFEQQYLSDCHDFNTFIMEWMDEENMLMYWHFMPQYHFITSIQDRSRILVDFIGRYENLEADFAQVCSKLHVKKPVLNPINVTKPAIRKYAYNEMYTPEMRHKVACLYHRDIDMFGYTFQ